jgi:hypothetical protein
MSVTYFSSSGRPTARLVTGAAQAEQAASWVWNASWLKTYVHKPCNHELFVAQSINMQTALEAALVGDAAGHTPVSLSPVGEGDRTEAKRFRWPLFQVDGITWVTHIDTDELLYPSGNHSFNLQRVRPELDAVPAEVARAPTLTTLSIPYRPHICADTQVDRHILADGRTH